MLLDDDEKLVELFMDNLLWGHIQIDWKEIPDESKKPREERATFKMGAYTVMRKQNPKEKDYQQIVEDLHTFFVIHRILGDIKGELRDREQEQHIAELEKDNHMMAEQLSQAYIPSHDKKVGTV